MREISFKDLTKEQRNILFTDNNSDLAVSGIPGTGKTILALKRIQKILKDNPNANILLLVFNKTMEKYLRSFKKNLITKHKYNISIYTFHGFYYRNFKEKAGFNWRQIVEKLKRNNIFEKYDYLFLDECQDIGLPFYNYLNKYLDVTINIFGDDHQKIKKNGSKFEDILLELNLAEKSQTLKTNFRNTINIMNIAIHFTTQEISGKVHKKGQNVVLNEFPSKKKEYAFIKNKCIDYGEHRSIGIILPSVNYIKNVYSELKTIQNIKVLRYYSQLYNENRQAWKRFNINPEKNVYLLSYKSCKGLEFDYVILPFLNDYKMKKKNKIHNFFVAMTRTRYTGQLFLSYNKNTSYPEILEKIPKNSEFLDFNRHEEKDLIFNDDIDNF